MAEERASAQSVYLLGRLLLILGFDTRKSAISGRAFYITTFGRDVDPRAYLMIAEYSGMYSILTILVRSVMIIPEVKGSVC